MWFKIAKFTRRIRGRCPYCGKKMLNGMGGSSLLSLGGLKICPDKHYAEELHMTGATLIHDNGGKPLPIKMMGDE
jgi:hypothetical protein